MSAQLDLRDIFQADHRPVGERPDDHLLEILHVCETALCDHRDRQFGAFRRRFPPNCPGWKVSILFADDTGNVGGREAELCHPGRVQDQAHRIILPAEHHCISDATYSFEIIDHVEERVIGDENSIFRRVAGTERDDRQQVRRHFLDRNALTDNFGRQLGLRQFLAVLGLYLSDVHIRPNLERELDGHVPVIGAGGIVVEKVVDAGKLHFDRARD